MDIYSIPDGLWEWGAASSTDNAIVRWNWTWWDDLQDSTVLIDDSDNITWVNALTWVSWGITITWWTASWDDLTLSSTGDATKWFVILGSTSWVVFDEVNNRLWVWVAATENTITIWWTTFWSTFSVHAEWATDLAENTLHRHSDTAWFWSHLLLVRSRWSEASETIVQSWDIVWRIDALWHDGTDYEIASQIDFEVDGTPWAWDMPWRIVFKTTPDWSATPVEALRISQDKEVRIAGNTVFTPSATTSITAWWWITATNTIMHIDWDGWPIDITANPQIAAWTDWQLLILIWEDDTNTVTLEDWTWLHIHWKAIFTDHDIMMLAYDSSESRWEEITRNFQASEKTWSFTSPWWWSGTFYIWWYYIFSWTNNDFTATQTIWTANWAYWAHAFLVLWAATVDTLTVTFTWTSVTDAWVRTTSDTEAVVFTHPASVWDYVETDKKWIWAVSIDHTSWTAKTCNWWLSKYWDNNNNNFEIQWFEATWRWWATDASANVSLLHHKATWWTYNAAADPTPPTAITDMNTDYSTEDSVINNQNWAWKRANLSTSIAWWDGEWTILQIVTTQNNTFENGNFMIRIIPS